MERRLQVAHGPRTNRAEERRASILVNATSSSLVVVRALVKENAMHRKNWKSVIMLGGLWVAASSVVSLACSSSDSDSGNTADSGASGDPSTTGAKVASATLAAQNDSGASGTATFTENGGAVTLTVSVKGVEPGTHGLHVHNGADCTSPGPHYGPDGGPYHGEFTVKVDDSGNGSLTTSDLNVTVSPGEYSVIGHPLVLHFPSDGGTAPPPRAACGMIVKQ
ncbi:Superoxide dismutase [Labilithrix luteola]|uniref:Superoxide dismutase n=1 Tax=Labilithrix luteola TaxID=1391654 RepID=A0A0K1QDE3_9BACT|nr:superoxide dismutase family protein [Labilithrix luteola]AKV03692.1 Superoxide dismutase [Labilithrix luteola]